MQAELDFESCRCDQGMFLIAGVSVTIVSILGAMQKDVRAIE